MQSSIKAPAYHTGGSERKPQYSGGEGGEKRKREKGKEKPKRGGEGGERGHKAEGRHKERDEDTDTEREV